MFSQFENFTRTITILSFVFALAISSAWATTYSGSVTVENGSTSDQTLQIVQEGGDHIHAEIAAGSLDAYMTEESLNEVEITCTFTEGWVYTGDDDDEDDDGDGEDDDDDVDEGYYTLSFEFGPSGAYFDVVTPLILKIKGRWFLDYEDDDEDDDEDTQFWLYDEFGDPIDGTRHNSADMIKFEIEHFSCYYYEEYCY